MEYSTITVESLVLLMVAVWCLWVALVLSQSNQYNTKQKGE